MLSSTVGRLVVSLVISGAAIALLLRGVDFGRLMEALRGLDPLYLLPAVFSTMLSYVLRGVRWGQIMSPIGTVGFLPLFSATLVGYMANNLLPARLGELVRAHYLARRERIPTASVLATLVVDRLWDGISVLVILLLTLLTLRLPPGMEWVRNTMLKGGYAVALLYLACIVFLIVLKRQGVGTIRPLFLKIGKSLGERLVTILDSFVAGVTLSAPRSLAKIAATSATVWLTALWPIDLVLRSFGVTIPFSGSMLIMVFLVFAVMVPAAPGYLGTFHLACVYGLKAFGIVDERGMSIAIVLHAVNFFPVIVAGLLALFLTRTPLSILKGEGEATPAENV